MADGRGADTGAREPQDSVSALGQRASEMRARAEAALADRGKGYPNPWGPKCYGCGGDEFRIDGYCSIECREFHNDVDVPDLARDVVALSKEVERLTLAAGVGVPPDTDSGSALTRALAALAEAVEGDAADRAYAAEFGASEWAAFVPKKVYEPLQAAREALAGVGEARPTDHEHIWHTSFDIRTCSGCGATEAVGEARPAEPEKKS